MFYFAYGSNMNSKRMSNACKNGKYKFLEKYKLKDYRFEYNGHSQTWDGPTGDVIEESSRQVLGILYEIDELCKTELDISEGYREKREMSLNIYKCIDVLVTSVDDKDEKPALTYAHVKIRKKEILNCKYKDIIIDGARERGLHEDYIANHLDVKCREIEHKK